MVPQHSRVPILCTGGAGYIVSHTVVALHEAGFAPVVILDNFTDSQPPVLDRLERILGTRPALEQGDVLDTAFVEAVLRKHRPAGVIHFAGDKAGEESVAHPLKYFRNILGGAISLLQAMETVYLGGEGDTGALDSRLRGNNDEGLGVQRPAPTLVFSSSVYADPATVPITEAFPRSHTNPYGHTKLVIEDMLQAALRAQPAWRIGILRYFGAHLSGLIGEHPAGIPNNLMPFVTQVCLGMRPHLRVFGSDYATPDGTGVRDYIHVQDLAAGHVAAMRILLARPESFTVNLGTGRGYSVLEVVRAFEQASGRKVPYQLVDRRPGDAAQCYGDASLARKILGWEATRSLQEMCADAWRWQIGNPRGYEGGAP